MDTISRQKALSTTSPLLPHTTETPSTRFRPTFRALLLGLILSTIVAIWVPYCMYFMQGPRMTLSHMSVAALILFFFMIFCVQWPLQRWKPRWAFRKPELVVLFILPLMASTIPGKAFGDYFLGMLGTPHYYASPENRWVELFFIYLPDWLMVNVETARGFYEGVGGEGVPWWHWLVPVFWWLTMLAALFLVMSCIAVIFRRQWVEYERLAFPLVRIPMELIDAMSGGRDTPAFMRGRPFWIGFSITLTILLWNCVSYFNWVPPIPIGTAYRSSIVLGQTFPSIPVQINIFAMCFAFFANISVLFSIWFFYLIACLEIGLLNQIGLVSSGAGGMATGAGGAGGAVSVQHFGGFWVFVLWGFWISRHHLKDVFGKAFGRRPDVDDSNELFSYRTAVCGLIVGLAYVGFWLNNIGMSPVVIVLFMAITLLLYIGVARIVAETGMVFLDLPVNSNQFSVVAIGSNNLSPSDLTALGLGHAISHNHRGLGLSSLMHSLKVADRSIPEKHRFFSIISITMLLVFIVTMAYAVYMGTTGIGAHGIVEMNASGFFDEIATWLNNAKIITNVELYFLGTGGAITSGLLFMYYRFPWWPLHPIGFTIAQSWVIVQEIVSIFLVWQVKWLLLTLGGNDLYQKTQPVIVGILLGYATGVAISFMVDVIWFPQAGHAIHNW